MDSKWARRRKLDLTELMHEPWILPPPESIVGRTITEAFHAAGLDPPRAHIVSFSLPLSFQLLATGRFITLLPLSMARLSRHLPLRMLKLESPQLSRPVGIMTLKNRMLSPLAERFIDCARKIGRSLDKRS